MLESFPPGFLSSLKTSRPSTINVVKSGPLESRFSKSVYARLKLLEVDPNYSTNYRKMKDQRFTQIPIDLSSNRKMRIKTVDYKGKETNELYYNSITLIKDMPKVRIKGIATKENQYGIQESDWVYFEQDKYNRDASKLNQYRVKGVDNRGLESRWVYSPLRTDKNEEVLFELLTDFFDIMLSMQDENIEYVVELATSDYFTKQILDYLPEFIKTMAIDEKQRVRYSEVLNVLEDNDMGLDEEKVTSMIEELQYINKEFPKFVKESIKIHTREISNLLRVYNLSDQNYFNFRNEDVFGVLTQILEDAMDLMLDSPDIEVMLKKDEEFHVLLQSSFDFKVQKDSLEAILTAAFDDNVVDLMKDVLKLMVDKSFLEWFNYSIKEDSVLYVKNFLKSMWTLLYSTDSIYREMLMYAEDYHEIQFDEQIIQYAMMDGDTIIGYTDMPFDILEMFIFDPLELHVDVDVKDTFINLLQEKGLNVLLTYMPEETLSMILSVQTTIQETSKPNISENLNMIVYEQYHTLFKQLHDIKEQITVHLQDHYQVDENSKTNIKDDMYLKIFDDLVERYTILQKEFNEQLHLLMNDNSNVKTTETYRYTDEEIIILKDSFKNILTIFDEVSETRNIQFTDFLNEIFTVLKTRIESFVMGREDDYENTWLVNPKDHITLNTKDIREVMVKVDRDDKIPDWITDRILYSIGNFDTDWPIGKMILGKHGLGGKDDYHEE